MAKMSTNKISVLSKVHANRLASWEEGFLSLQRGLASSYRFLPCPAIQLAIREMIRICGVIVRLWR